MDQTLFDELQTTIEANGPAQAIDRLCDRLRERKELASLFYALLMKKRFELGVSPVPTGPAAELPEAMHEQYENAIRDAGRLVGGLLLEQGDIAQAYHYFRMLGELQPVTQALEKATLPEGEDCQPLIELAFHHGANTARGFDWIVERFGICSAITILGGQLNGANFAHGPEARDYCLARLARALHDQLTERIRNDIVRKEGSAPSTKSVPELLAGRDWLFDEDNYHVDTSHLSSVVHMCQPISKPEDLKILRELCSYGQRLSPQFQNRGDPPFEDTYKDFAHFYNILAGEKVDEGLAHFRAKADNPDPDYSTNFGAELLVNLLIRLNRPAEALATAKKYLVGADERQLSCPGIGELCRKVNDYRTLAEVAKERGDPVHFVAGLIAARTANGK